MDAVIPNKEKTLQEGVIAPWNTPTYSSMLESLLEAAPRYGIPLDVPFRKLTKEQVKIILEGRGGFAAFTTSFSGLINENTRCTSVCF